jgi:hypothetical protein
MPIHRQTSPTRWCFRKLFLRDLDQYFLFGHIKNNAFGVVDERERNILFPNPTGTMLPVPEPSWPRLASVSFAAN